MKTIITTKHMYSAGKPLTENNFWELMIEVRKATKIKPARLVVSEDGYHRLMDDFAGVVKVTAEVDTLFGLDIEVDHNLKKGEWLVGNKDEMIREGIVA